MSEFEQCGCDNGEWQGNWCFDCDGTGVVAKQSMQGDIAALQAQVEALRKDAGMWRSVSFSIEEAIRNGMCNYEIEDAYEAAISKGGE